ncbi:MAG TPA: tripartite tricarboxylate transporter substrate binding protein [Burkholderiales bacterium]
MRDPQQQRRRLLAALGAGALAGPFAAPSITRAQARYPSRPVTLLVSQPAGGDADALCRNLQPKMAEVLGQSVVIDNRGGAGGNIGTALAAKAAPDGYTVGFVNQGTMAFNPHLYPNPGYKIDDFTPVCWMTSINLLIACNPAVPANNLAEFLALARKEPGKYTYGTAGNGSANHLCGEMLKSMAGVNLTHVPFRGGAQAILACMGGDISSVVAFPLAALPQVRAGKLKALAVTGAKRAAALPNVPTVAESGVKDYEFTSWMGLVLPKGSPQEAADRVYQATAAALKVPDTVEKLQAAMTEPVAAGPKEFGALIARENTRWAKLIKQFNVRID